ncbi:RmlC-like cupin domain-containing protein [Astrocystis sublimbata]|nr:RmlC-like cupin domain-containing protein [Astrocystis sublimbata]
MASLFSLLPDILPMIMPADITVVKATDLETQRQKSDESPMIRQGAIIGKSDRMCATILRAKPHCSSAVHHHGEQGGLTCHISIWELLLIGNYGAETIIYAASGKGILVTNTDDKVTRHELSAGDFAFIPPWTEHQEINETDEDVVWILIRSGPEPQVSYLTGWDGDQAKAD